MSWGKSLFSELYKLLSLSQPHFPILSDCAYRPADRCFTTTFMYAYIVTAGLQRKFHGQSSALDSRQPMAGPFGLADSRKTGEHISDHAGTIVACMCVHAAVVTLWLHSNVAGQAKNLQTCSSINWQM